MRMKPLSRIEVCTTCKNLPEWARLARDSGLDRVQHLLPKFVYDCDPGQDSDGNAVMQVRIDDFRVIHRDHNAPVISLPFAPHQRQRDWQLNILLIGIEYLLFGTRPKEFKRTFKYDSLVSRPPSRLREGHLFLFPFPIFRCFVTSGFANQSAQCFFFIEVKIRVISLFFWDMNISSLHSHTFFVRSREAQQRSEAVVKYEEDGMWLRCAQAWFDALVKFPPPDDPDPPPAPPLDGK